MKRLLVTSIFIMACASISAQSLLNYRKIIQPDGLSLMSETVQIKEKGQPTLNVAIMYETTLREDESKSGFSLVITFASYREDWIIPMYGKLLLKTSSEKVISLSQIVPESMRIYDPETGYDNVSYLKSAFDHYDDIRSKSVYRKFGKYPISDEDLAAILDEGVIKIRLETTGESIECEYPVQEEIRVNRKKELHNKFAYSIQSLFSTVIENIDPYTTF